MALKTEIINAMKKKKLLIGLKSAIKGLESADIEKIVIARNCGDDIRTDINKYSEISGVKIEIFNGNNKELGTLCKKPFPISVLAVKKT